MVIAFLAFVFLTFFGYLSYVKYLNHDTVFTETRVKFDPHKPVGITIFTWKKTLLHGWKDNENEALDIKKLCNESNDLNGWNLEKDEYQGLNNLGNGSIDFERVVQCINDGTFKHNDTIKKYTKVKLDDETDVTKETIHFDDISAFFVGQSYSIKVNFEEGDGYFFNRYFKPGQSYSVFIHDPNIQS